MDRELLNNLIYSIFTTTIGAGIGGWFAYKVARGQYFRDQLDETIGFIFLLKKTADRIDKKSGKIKKYIRNTIDEKDTMKIKKNIQKWMPITRN